jgi:prepilin-type N-terminal cleavage/methylation domain-containing protein
MKRHFRAFTLIEIVTSLVILSVLLLACASMLSLSNYQTGSATTRISAQFQAADVADQITDDLNVALNFTQRTATSVTFTVPDRISAGTPEPVCYSWAGTAGSPLTRQFNNGTVVNIANSVQAFNLAYTTRLMGKAPISESLIFQHDTMTVGTSQDFTVDNTHSASEYFVPNLPSGTASYSITHICLFLKQAGPPDAFFNVQVTTANALFQPTSTVLAQTTVYETSLDTNYQCLRIPMTGLSGLNPQQGLCIVVSYNNGGPQACRWQYESALLLNPVVGAYWCTSNNGNWSLPSITADGMMDIYGTVP